MSEYLSHLVVYLWEIKTNSNVYDAFDGQKFATFLLMVSGG